MHTGITVCIWLVINTKQIQNYHYVITLLHSINNSSNSITVILAESCEDLRTIAPHRLAAGVLRGRWIGPQQ